MMDALARRGPDSHGDAAWPGAALGHRRLAILDLSAAGHQPMLTDDGQVGLVFNGCIYNFLELKQDLEKTGYPFRGSGDTEVLLAGYREWGIDELVRRLHGMFAFAVWDHPQRKLTLVRDRLGVKPLMWWSSGKEIAFASTLGALRAAGINGPIDADAIVQFLEFGFVLDDRSVWQGLHKLPPAHILEWQAGEVRQRCYWSLNNEPDPNLRIDWEEAVRETERLLLESVRLRLCSDVPIGALLSGGIDSSLVCWALAENKSDVRAFTVGMPGDPADETAAARATAARLGIRHQMVELPEQEPMLETMCLAFSEPFACQSAQALLRVSQAIKPEATVLLTGDGGDDVFFGYPSFLNTWRAQKLAEALPASLARSVGALGRSLPGNGAVRKFRNLLECATGGLGPLSRMRPGMPYYEDRGMLGPRLTGRKLAQREIADSFESARHLLRDAFGAHRKQHFTSEFMPKVDGATMYFALEARAPLLDHKLWEFGASLPAHLRLHGGQPKAILREIARRRVGVEAAGRAKQGFTVPAERWLAGRWSKSLDILRGNPLVVSEGWINPGVLDRAIDEALRNQWVPPQIAHLLTLEHWLAHQSHQAAPDFQLADAPAGA